VPDSPKNDGLLPALVDLTRWLTNEKVAGVVIGGVAVSFMGGPRFTEDVDCLVDLGNRDWADFFSSGAPFGFAGRIEDPVEFAARSRVLLLRHEPSDTSVDLSIAGILFEHEAINRATVRHTNAVDIRIATPEDLIVMKAVAQRDKDCVDIDSILRTHPVLDVERIRKWTELFAEGLEQPEIADQIRSLLSKRSN
jgi:hypothetical protein